MEITPEIQKRSEKIQGDLQNIVGSAFLINAGLSYQDAMNVAIYTKLAELELKIEEHNKRLDAHFDSLDSICNMIERLNS